jgi:hypothetical protein
MKSPPPSRSRPNWLHRLIRDATGALAKDLAQIETKEQLADAARQAFARLNDDRELYDLDQAGRMAIFNKIRAESALRDHYTPANRAAVLAAEAIYQSARTNLLVRLDETKPN